MASKKRRSIRYKIRTIRRDRFGRFNKRGRTVQRIKVKIVRPRRDLLGRFQAKKVSKPKPPKGVVLVSKDRPLGLFAFQVKDQRPDVADSFVGKNTVTAKVVYGYTDPDAGEAYDVERFVEFEGGEDEEEFWDNYHDAVRDDLDDFIDSDIGEGDYEGFSVMVGGLA